VHMVLKSDHTSLFPSSLLPAVPVTAGYSSEDVHSYFPIMWPYDRPMKRTHATLDPYPIMDYYTHLQVPTAPKYMKPEPIAYYQYPEDPERYQASITVSVQSHVNPFSSTSTSAVAYSPSTQYSSYSSGPIPATLPTTTSYPVMNPGNSSASAAVAVGGVAYSVHTGAAMCGGATAAVGGVGGSGITICCPPDPQQAMSSCSPVRSAMGDDSSTRPTEHCTNAIGTPLTPPLSVSPPISSSPTPRQSISPQPSNTTYLDKETVMGYRSSTSSPCIPDCDSTTNASELPLQMLSELSEGLPLTGTCV
jgi:hypothetical protein